LFVKIVMSFDKKSHWENIYESKMPADVSWYQTEPAVSLELIVSSGIGNKSKIIDVGGGASVLVDKLLNRGFEDLTVLDISSKAMDYAKKRLCNRANSVKWIEADVTEFEFSGKYDLWHDRAVFHFLADEDDRKKYVRNLERVLNPGGYVIIATFAIGGPVKCSGLDIVQYNSEKIYNEFNDSFKLFDTVSEGHITPWGQEQKFTYFCLKKVSPKQ